MDGEIFAPFIFFAFLCKAQCRRQRKKRGQMQEVNQFTNLFFLIICLTKQKTFSTAPLMLGRP